MSAYVGSSKNLKDLKDHNLIGSSKSLKGLKGYLAHQKTTLPPRTTTGPWAWAYCRVPGVGVFL